MAQASDVIWPEAGRTWLSLDMMADELEGLAKVLQRGDAPISAAMLRRHAAALKQRHDHSDPCDDEACPCRKAEADDWRDHGAVRY